MPIELASVAIKQKPWVTLKPWVKQKPWGSINLLPWNGTSTNGKPVCELWFQRADAAAPDRALLLKLLFTTDHVEHHSSLDMSLAPPISAVSENLFPKTPEAYT